MVVRIARSRPDREQAPPAAAMRRAAAGNFPRGTRFQCAVSRAGVGLQWVQFLPGNWVAPASSYRSGGGGNETVGAFETNVSHGDAASRQAVTQVSVKQASKSPMWSPTLLEYGEGRRRWG